MFRQSGPQMSKDFEGLAARAAPAIFVVFWSTGFIATKYVLNSADPLTYLAIRMALVVAMMTVIVAVARPRWPDRAGIGHSVVAGILVHGFYLGGTAVAIAHSIPAGLSALIPGLQPILTSTIANRWLGERVAMERAIARARGRGADPARSPHERGGGLGLACHRRVVGQHYLGHALSATLLQQDRLARGKPGPIYRGDGLLRGRRGRLRGSCGALDRRIRSGAGLARHRALDRIDRAIVLADPPIGGNLGGKPVLFGAGGDRRHGLCAVRRAARCVRDRGHDRLRCRGFSGQPARGELTASQSKSLRVLSGGFAREALSASTSWPSFSSSRPSCSPSWRISSPLSWISSRPFSSLPSLRLFSSSSLF